jgi:hypothetical protein
MNHRASADLSRTSSWSPTERADDFRLRLGPTEHDDDDESAERVGSGD